MSSIDLKVKAIFERVRREKEIIAAPFIDLQGRYKDVMGAQDPRIDEVMRHATKAIDEKETRLMNQLLQFNTIMSFPDAVFRVEEFGNQNIEDDPVYSSTKDPRLRLAIRMRTFHGSSLESEYIGALFGLPPIEVPEEKKLPEVNQPVLVQYDTRTVNEIIEGIWFPAVKRKLKAAAAYVDSFAPGTYELSEFNPDDLLQLETMLKMHVSGPPSVRAEFLFGFISAIDYKMERMLTSDEQKLVTLTINRDEDSHPGEFKGIGKVREQKLAALSLRLFYRNLRENRGYRIGMLPVSPDAEFGGWQATKGARKEDYFAVLLIEKFIIDHIRAKREPEHSKIVHENLSRIIKHDQDMFDRGIYDIVKRDENMVWLMGFAHSIKEAYEREKTLTNEQRKAAERIILQYRCHVSRVYDHLSESIEACVSEGSKRAAKNLRILSLRESALELVKTYEKNRGLMTQAQLAESLGRCPNSLRKYVPTSKRKPTGSHIQPEEPEQVIPYQDFLAGVVKILDAERGHISQKEVASRLGICANTYRRYLKTEVATPLEAIRRKYEQITAAAIGERI